MIRKKTTIMLPPNLLKQVDDMGRMLGTGRNGFLAVAAGMLLSQLDPMQNTPMKRSSRLLVLDRVISRVLKDAGSKA